MLPHKSPFADYMENLGDHGPRPSGMLPLTNVPYFLLKVEEIIHTVRPIIIMMTRYICA